MTNTAEYAPPPATPARSAKNGLGLASLIVGAVGLVLAFIPFINFVAILIAIVGLILGVIALFLKGKARGIAIAGTAVSGVALILSIIMVVVYTAGFVSAVDDAVNDSITSAEPAAPAEGDAAPAEEAPAEDAPADAAVGTRANPAPIGSTAEFSEAGAPIWKITPGAPVLNANDVVAAENQFNEAAPAGSQFAMLPVTVEYVGPETGTPAVDISVSFVSAAGTTHETYDVTAVGPDELFTINEMYPGSVETGNVVVAVPSADVENGTWAVSGGLFSEDYFFAAQ